LNRNPFESDPNFEKGDQVGGGDFHLKRLEILVGNFELKPLRRPIWEWFELYSTTKIRDSRI